MNLFHYGKELFDKFGLSMESELTFTDHCKQPISPYLSNIRFTSKALIFSYPKDAFCDMHDDWTEFNRIEFVPWHNVLSLQNIKGEKVVAEFDQQAIANWLSSITDPIFCPSYVDVRRGAITFIVDGQPRSIRSVSGKQAFKEKVEQAVDEIKTVYPSPWGENVEMKLDVFSLDPDSNHRPDVDRFSGLIMDAFKGVAYQDDRQIIDLRPRIIDTAQAFTQLECRSHPMDQFALTDIPLGSVFPLAIGVTEYYVIRIIYYYKQPY